MDKHQAIWDKRYEKLLQAGRTLAGEPWLEAWLHLVPPGEGRRAFDIGCGPGYITRLLIEKGFDVSAVDISERALELCRRSAPKARIERADIRKEMPFAGDRFELIVADLSLHYFTWDKTVSIGEQIIDRLVPGGIFAGRFNSIGDTNYGASSGTSVSGERNLLIVNGIEKRFFTRDCFGKLFKVPWRMVSLTEKTTSRFDARKVLWEVVAAKGPDRSAEHDDESPFPSM